MDQSKRATLLHGLFGASALGLRALATGLPLQFLLDPLRADADVMCASRDRAQYLILSTSSDGDPLNAHVPGTYDDPDIFHPPFPEFAKAPISISGQTYYCSPLWDLKQTLQRTVFFHHTTLTNIHPSHPKVLKLLGATKNQEMLPSILAKYLQPCLGTVRSEPLAVGVRTTTEVLSYGGRPLNSLLPLSLRDGFSRPVGVTLQGLRDKDLNRLNALFRARGTPAQKAALDRYSLSQSQARALGDSFQNDLALIQDNDITGQIAAAVALIKMNVTPVVTIHIPFGGDNHSDVGFVKEHSQHLDGIAALLALLARLAKEGLSDKVTFASMNVFGRTLSSINLANPGRDHHAGHHCTLMIGKGFRGSVIGGVAKNGNDFWALPIDPASGAAVAGGAIPYDQTLNAAAKTLGAGLGLDAATLESEIRGGQIVRAALV